MPATVRVSAGDQVYAGATITELTGKDISGDTIVLALLRTGEFPDANTAEVTPDVDENPAPAKRLVKMLITDDVDLGTYQLWGRITDTPEREWLRLDTVTAI